MPRRLLWCTSIVAAFQLHLAAASPHVEVVAVTPAVDAAAWRLGVDQDQDPALFLSEITRRLYTAADRRDSPTPPGGERGSEPATSSGRAAGRRIPVPLPADVWGRAVFHRAIAAESLIDEILGDPRAALIAHGLTGVDDSTLAFFATHPSLVTFLHQQAAGAFAAFGHNFQIADGRVVVPGGVAAVPLWEAVVHERVSQPERFAQLLFGSVNGRLAYLYDVIASADPASATFALGFWMPDRGLQLARFIHLADACVRGYGEWQVESLPFSRPSNDLALLLFRIRLLPDGAPAPPAGRAFWAGAFDLGDAAAGAAGNGSIDAAWLVDVTSGAHMYERGERLDRFAFAQRVFAEAPAESGEVAEVVRGFGIHRMLLLTLERIGVRRVATFTAMARQADAVSASSRDRRFWTMAQFEGVLAIIARMHRVRTIDDAAAERLVLSLAQVPLDNGRNYAGRMAAWIATDLAAVLPSAQTWEQRIGAALAGPSVPSTTRFIWEGQSYRVDLAQAERQRLDAVRSRQGGHTVDLAVVLDAEATAIASPALTRDAASAAGVALRHLAAEHEAELRRPALVLLAPGVEPPDDGFELVTRAADELTKGADGADPKRAARIAASLTDLADIVLGDALVSFAYAMDLGGLDQAALLGVNVALRHDFGLARRDAAMRAKLPWTLPRQEFTPGSPWRVSGSLLGLDIALAPLALRRLSSDVLPQVPKVGSIEREAFAVGVSLLQPASLTDGDRDAIAEAIERGRQRVAAVANGAEPVGALADRLHLDGRRRRGVEWAYEHEPSALVARFSLAELLVLGGGAGGDVDLAAWGPSGVHALGCACTWFPRTSAWRILAGRPQLPYMANTLTELNLGVAMMLREMKVPAPLTRSVLAFATRDFLDRAAPADASDWWSLVRMARLLRRQQIEDYVAAAAAVDGPLIPETPDGSAEP